MQSLNGCGHCIQEGRLKETIAHMREKESHAARVYLKKALGPVSQETCLTRVREGASVKSAF